MNAQFEPERGAQVASLRVPPHAIDAEQAVLGGLMYSPQSLPKIADWLSESDFYRKDHRLTVVTDEETENALIVDLDMEEVILVDTTTGLSTVTPSSDSTLPGPFQTVPSDPAATAPTINAGAKQVTDVTSSMSAGDMAYTIPLVPSA